LEFHKATQRLSMLQREFVGVELHVSGSPEVQGSPHNLVVFHPLYEVLSAAVVLAKRKVQA